MVSVGVFQIAGYFMTALIVLLVFAPPSVTVVRNLVDGDFRGAIIEGGGRFFVIDTILLEESGFLLEEVAREDLSTYDIYSVSFHLVYALSLLFMLFFGGILLYKGLNKLTGLSQFEPITNLMITAGILAAVMILQFLYGVWALDEIVFPLKGVFTFVKSLPEIVRGLLGI